VTYPLDNHARAYLSTIGFPLGKDKDARTYTPIHHFSKNSEVEISRILTLIESEFPEQSIIPLKYILSELGGANIEEHSNYTLATIMAQMYPKKEFIDIGIYDNGITIPGKFEQSKIPFDQDGQAIYMALYGKSTKEPEGGRGFGLPTSRNLVLNGLKGSFYVFSRTGAVEIDTRHPSTKYISSKT
jgi:hypothetical protein